MLAIASVVSIYSFPPFDYKIFVFVGHLTLFYAIYRSSSYKKAFFYGFVFGFFYFSCGLHWLYSIMDTYETTDKIVVVLIVFGSIVILSVIFGLFSMLANLKAIKNRYISIWIVWYLPTIFVLLEYTRSIAFSGFTWYTPASALLDIGLNSLLPFGGVLFMDYIFFVIVAILLHIFILKKQNIIYPTLSSILVATVLVISTNITYTTPLEDKKIDLVFCGRCWVLKDTNQASKVFCII